MRYLSNNRSSNGNSDIESSFDFKDINLSNHQLDFIRKVYGILSMQLAFTVLMCLAAVNTSFGAWQMSHPGVYMFAFVTSIGLMIALACFTSTARSVPTNYILLCLFTICKGYVVSGSISYIDPQIVLIAAVMTMIMTVALTMYAATTSTDFTLFRNTLFICGIALCLFCIFSYIYQNQIIACLICAASIILYAFYLIYDTQMIIGNGKYGLTYDDYIIAALWLYVDIVILFVRLAQLLSMLLKKR